MQNSNFKDIKMYIWVVPTENCVNLQDHLMDTFQLRFQRSLEMEVKGSEGLLAVLNIVLVLCVLCVCV